MMFIEIDGYFQQAILYGKYCNLKQLQRMYDQVVADTTVNERIEVFCKLHHFVIVSCEAKVEMSYVIDLDTDRIYIPVD